MPDIWAYCNSCQRWFYTGKDEVARSTDVTCPVCLHPPVCFADHGKVAEAAP